jgi:predicted ATPase
MLTIHARNLRALRYLHWPLEGVSVLTGANGAGKTTTLLALKLIRAAFDRGLPEAVSIVLGGSYNLRHRDAPEGEAVELGLDVDDLSWRLRLIRSGSTVNYATHETLSQGTRAIFTRDSLGNLTYLGVLQELGAPAAELLGLRWVAETHGKDESAKRLSSIIRRIQVFHDPDLRKLRASGSQATQDRHLHSSGENVFTMLRKWRDKREDMPRFEFVNEGLRAAFPQLYDSLDFDTTAQTVNARVYRPNDEAPTPIHQEANGILAMLVLLAQVASADQGGLVAIDEPENSLHPFAIRRFIELTRSWSRRREITVILTTHSPVLLDKFNGEHDRVFVLDHDTLEQGHEALPVPLVRLRDRDWLANYTLGELYTGGDFATNEPA